MRHLVFGHQFANESFAKTGNTSHLKPPLLHTSKIIARDFPSIRKSKLALSACPLASAAPTANFLSTRYRRTLCSRHELEPISKLPEQDKQEGRVVRHSKIG